MTNSKPYYSWIDTAKVIGIFFVVYGHGGLAIQPIRDIIYVFHMPLFFFLSGVLYRPMSPIQTLKKDWRGLLIPYLLLNLICLIPFLLSPLKGTFSLERLFQRIGAIFMGLGYSHEYWVPVSTPCWFLIALFLCRMLLSLGHRNFNNVFLLSTVAVSVTIIYLLRVIGVDWLVPLDSALLSIPFLCLGYKLKPYLLKEDQTTRPRIFFLLAVIGLILTYIVYCFNGAVDTNKCQVGNFLLLYYVGGILGTLSICLFSKCKTMLIGGVHVFASGTLLIIGLNLWMIVFIKKVFMLFQNASGEGVQGFLIAIVCMAVFYPLILLAKRFFPMILGGRK